MADESLDEVSTLDISKLKVPDLKKELKSRGLSTTGNKNELIERLQAAMKSIEGATTDCIDDIEEDLLNDDDDEHMDEQESLINDDLDSALDDLPKAPKRKSEEKSEVSSGPPKKVILKRNTSETLAAMAKASKPEEKPLESKVTEEKEDGKGGSEEKKVVKLSELSAKERLEMRAKKFGVIEFSDDAKKVARAERFGAIATNKTSHSGSIGKEANANIDVLKQRAARFGGSVSSVMSDLEKKDKMEKRKERFGGAEVNGKTSTEAEAAKIARMERFKTTVK